MLPPIKIKKALEENKAVITPTDTVYGVLALEEELIVKIKRRENSNKQIVRFIGSISQIGNDLPEGLIRLSKSFWPGPLTLIYRGIGYRIPNHSTILEVLQCINKPIYASSANITNKPPVKSLDEAKREFMDSPVSVEFVEGNAAEDRPSTVYDYDNDVLIRKGTIGLKDIRRILRSKEALGINVF